MAHELEIKDGEARMMYAGQIPWHGLGTKVEKEVTSAAALRLAGLDWVVEKRPVYFQAGAAVQEVMDKKAIVRTEDESILGIVANTYEPIQNTEVFDFLDSLVGEGLAMFHTAGSLFGGRRIFISCKLPTSFKVGPDQIDKYLVAMTSHDATTAFHIKWTPIRVVCNNTLTAAMGRTFKDAVSIYHTKEYGKKVESAREILGLTEGYYQRLDELFNRLIEVPMDASEFQNFTQRLIPQPEKEDGEKVNLTRWEKRQAELLNVFKTGIGLDAVKDTRWAAYNAVAEDVDHHRKTKKVKHEVEETRMTSIVWGYGADTKQRAFEMLVDAN